MLIYFNYTIQTIHPKHPNKTNILQCTFISLFIKKITIQAQAKSQSRSPCHSLYPQQHSSVHQQPKPFPNSQFWLCVGSRHNTIKSHHHPHQSIYIYCLENSLRCRLFLQQFALCRLQRSPLFFFAHLFVEPSVYIFWIFPFKREWPSDRSPTSSHKDYERRTSNKKIENDLVGPAEGADDNCRRYWWFWRLVSVFFFYLYTPVLRVSSQTKIL